MKRSRLPDRANVGWNGMAGEYPVEATPRNIHPVVSNPTEQHLYERQRERMAEKEA